jgi:cardiolipin synthase
MPDSGVAPSNALLTLPNIISFARLCAVPLAIWLVLHQRFLLAFLLFALAGISDAIDGWLARRRGGTVLGSILDPLADKALMVGMYVTLAVIGQLPDWLAILVVFRDVVIIGGVVLLWMTNHPMQIRPMELSKANTALQIALVATVLGLDAASIDGGLLRLVMVILVTCSTLLSGGAYVVRVARLP